MLDHVIESEPPGPKTEAPSNASQKHVQKLKGISPQQQLQDFFASEVNCSHPSQAGSKNSQASRVYHTLGCGNE